MNRESINPWDWGLQFSMDQGEAITGLTRHINLSGQISVDPDPEAEMGLKVIAPNDIRGQMVKSLANIDAILEKADMNRSNLLTLRFFTTEMEGFLANYDVYANWIAKSGIRPPQSLIGVACLALPDIVVEIEATAGE
jgi:2-iminobutanoate/2-iminopropanoate deaminase